MPRPKWMNFKSASSRRGKASGSSRGAGGQQQASQLTISKFFSQKQTTDDFSNGDAEMPIVVDDSTPRKSKEAPVKLVSSPFGKRFHEAAEENVSKRQRCNLDDGSFSAGYCTPCSPGTTAQASISKQTKKKLNTFLLEDNDRNTERNVEGVTVEDLKRPSAQHVNAYFEDGVSEERRTEEDGGSDGEGSQTEANNKSPKSTGLLAKFAATTQKVEGSRTGALKGKVKYTPLEQQVIDLKRNHTDAILFVECGYKYRFFGNDAEIAAKELNIFAHMDHNFMTASIPTHRLFVHVRRLVAKGYKVGVVKQTETAALKAAGDNRNAPFTRQLSALYTKSTLIGEDVDPVSGESQPGQMSSAHLMCIYEPETRVKKGGPHTMAVVSVQPATGEIIYDVFEDTPTRSELETRITHIQPCELLLPLILSTPTERLIDQLVTFSCRSLDQLRVERMDDKEFDFEKAVKGITEFYSEFIESNPNKVVDPGLSLPKEVKCCLNALLTYLKDFNLHSVLKLKSNIHQFSSKKCHMHLNAGTLRNLEVFRNMTDGREHGSLIRVLDHTATKFGARQLRQWVAKPLLDISDIIDRQEAISELITPVDVLNNLRNLLPKLPDLERGLCTIFHKKCSTMEFFVICKALELVNQKLAGHQDQIKTEISSPLLRRILTEVPELLDGVSNWVSAISEKAAREGDKTLLFVDNSHFPEVVQCKKNIAEVKAQLDGMRREFAKQLGVFSLDYKTVLGTEYLIEVKNSQVSQVPKEWIKINGTKAVSRFQTPSIVSSVKQLSCLREQLTRECTAAWMTFLGSFEERYLDYQRAVKHLATLDCLLSLSATAKQEGFCRPSFTQDTTDIHIEKGRHPVVDVLLGEQEQYVANDTHLEAERLRCMVITGPNMGGKSSYIKQVALLSIMAQVGSYVPAESAKLGVMDAIYTRMGASDELFAGRSTFMVELQEASEIMKEASTRSLVILDELGRGTSTHDGVAIAFAALRFFVEEVKCLTLFVTHYPPLAEIESMYPGHVLNYHMSFMVDDEDGTGGEEGSPEAVTFLYQLVEGMAARSYGLNVARLASITPDIIRMATARSRQLEVTVTGQRKEAIFKQLCEADENHVEQIIKELKTGLL